MTGEMRFWISYCTLGAAGMSFFSPLLAIAFAIAVIVICVIAPAPDGVKCE